MLISTPFLQHSTYIQQYGPNLDRIKCRLLEGTNAQEVRDMLGKGIESALVNPSALVFESWKSSDGETISGINPEAMAVDPALVSSIQCIIRCLRQPNPNERETW